MRHCSVCSETQGKSLSNTPNVNRISFAGFKRAEDVPCFRFVRSPVLAAVRPTHRQQTCACVDPRTI